MASALAECSIVRCPAFRKYSMAFSVSPASAKMIGHHLGLRFDRVAESRHQGVGNPTVKLLALTPHHSGIGGILDQRMLEDVG